MKNKGFTLVEIMGVIVIVGLLLLLIVPNLVNRISGGKGRVTQVTKDIIYNGASQYIRENKNVYKVGEYCVLIKQLINDEKLKSPVKDVTGEINNGNALDEGYAVHVRISGSGNEEYELEETGACLSSINAPKPKIEVDNENLKVTIEWPQVGEGTEYPYEIEKRSYSIPNDNKEYEVSGNISERKVVKITANQDETPHLTKSGNVEACIKYKDVNKICTSRTVNVSGVIIEFHPDGSSKKWMKSSDVEVKAISKYGIAPNQKICYKWESTKTYNPKGTITCGSGNKINGTYVDSNTITATVKDSTSLGFTGDYYLVIGQGIKTNLPLALDTDVISSEFKLDNTPPAAPKITNPVSGYTGGSINLTVESKDNESGMESFQYTYNANATKISTTNDQQNWIKLKGCNNKNKCKTEPWSASRNQLVYIRACDKVGNCSEKSSTYIRIDKVLPTCSVTKNTSNSPDGITVTVTCDDPQISGQPGSGVKTCAGVSGKSAKKTGLKSSQTYTVEDNMGNKGTCKVTVSTRKQYAQRRCSSCKRCSSAGCESYGSWVCTSWRQVCNSYYQKYSWCNGFKSEATAFICKPKSQVQCGKGQGCRNCTYICSSYSACASYRSECSNGYYPCNKYKANCSKCNGCSSWGSYGGWQNSKPTCSGNYSCKERTVYY